MTATPLRLVMMGTGSFALPIFKALLQNFPHQVVGLVTQPARSGSQPRGTSRLVGQPLAALATAHAVPILQPESINTPSAIAALHQWQPDVLIVAAYGQILAPEVLAIPRWGAINVHASLLPRHRGAAPVAFAILQGDEQTGVTLIRMTAQLDAGDILAQQAIPIQPDDTTGTLEARLAELGAGMTVDLLHRLAAGEQPPALPQDPSRATRAPKIRKSFGLIDWSQSPHYLERFVRAMQPWPTAYTFLHQAGRPPQRLLITRLSLGPPLPSTPSQPPGTLQLLQPAPPHTAPRLAVVTGAPQLVLIEELQPAGKRRMSAAEFLRGHPVSADARFGPETVPS
jgi:methionyl-tRNA formyltransferase